VEVVGATGPRAPDQHRTSDPEEAVAWARRRGTWPVIVKPLRSSSSDHVLRCGSEREVEAAVDAVLRSRTVLDEANHAVLVQEYLDGTEYIVDTVSRDGRHLLAAVWRYGKPAASESFVCYDSMTLLPGDGERQRALFAFAKGALDALGIRHGPAHCELMWVDGAPVLVEVGARLSAGNNCTLNRVCSGSCQLDLTIEAYADPARFLAHDDAPYVVERTAANVFLIPPAAGILRGAPRLAEIETLASFVEMQAGIEPGAPAPRVAGVVTLIHADPAVVARDVERIRHLERNGLFDIAAAVFA
jgi:biotin carboxylase